MKGRRGFTLIELLVVVLIIGILAAVALPQYERAVDKARISEMFIALQSIYRANESFRLSSGSYTQNISQLDLDFQGTLSGPDSANYYIIIGDKFIYSSGPGSAYSVATVSMKNEKLRLYEGVNRRIACVVKGGETRYENVCKSLNGAKPSSWPTEMVATGFSSWEISGI